MDNSKNLKISSLGKRQRKMISAVDSEEEDQEIHILKKAKLDVDGTSQSTIASDQKSKA